MRASQRRSSSTRITSWIISTILMVAFVIAGATKLAGAELHKHNFMRWGYPTWTVPLTGVIELVAALLLIFPRTRFFGATLIVCEMIGAIATHARFAEYMMFPLPVVLLALAASAAALNRP